MIHTIFRIVFFIVCISYFSQPLKAGVTVGVNNLSVVHKSSNGLILAIPDVCKTPTPGGPVPIPYPDPGDRWAGEHGCIPDLRVSGSQIPGSVP